MSIQTVVERAEAVGMARFGVKRAGGPWHLIAKGSVGWTPCYGRSAKEGTPSAGARWCRVCLVVLAEAERKVAAT